MTARLIPVQAVVSANECAALEKGAELIGEALGAAGPGEPWRVEVRLREAVEDLDPGDDSVVIVSLLSEVDLDEPWADTEARLQARFQALLEAGFVNLFVCTVLRHAGDGPTPQAVAARRVRIRRLNLLAARLSQELGLMVVDLDRELADLGARPLQTDYRLGGPYAAAAAGKSFAMSLLLVGLDAFVPMEAQSRAREIVAAFQPPRSEPTRAKIRVMAGQAVALRAGRKSQVIESATDAVDENLVALYINRLIKGQLNARDAAGLFAGVVGRRGLRSTTIRLVGGLRKVARDMVVARR